MEKLKGKTILIGKEPDQGRLLLAIVGGKTACIGAPNSVPNSVSRCKVPEGVAHAKISIDQNSNMVLTNLKPQNVTFVNGSEIASKRIQPNNIIELGQDHYKIAVSTIIEIAKKLVRITDPSVAPDSKPLNIKHLEKVWTDYHDSLKRMREKQKKINLIRSGCGIFTMCAMPCIFFLGPIGYALTGIGVIGNIYSFVGLKNDNTTDEQERLMEEFQDHYVCPNENCNKFLGNLSYKLLKKQYSMQCPYCKTKFVEK